MRQVRPLVIREQDCKTESWDDSNSGSVHWRTLISGDRTPTDALTLGVLEIEAGASRELPLHRHEQVEVYYVLSGEGVVTVGGFEDFVGPGTAVYIPGSAKHGIRNASSGLLRILYVFRSDSFDEVRYEFDPA